MMINAISSGWQLSGPLTMSTASQVLNEAEAQWPEQDWEIDLAQLTQVDSAAVSVLLTWHRMAKERNQKIRFKNLPQNLCSLADLYGVADFLTSES